MADEKKYLLVMSCSDMEDHDGERWIDEEEFNELKQRSDQNKVGLSCSTCNLQVKDSEGNIIFSHC